MTTKSSSHQWVVTGTSPVVEADTWEDAITRAEDTSGWHWEPTEVKPKTFQSIHITGEGFRTLSIYRLFFAKALADVRARQEAYDTHVKEWYDENPGYQFPTCIHGSSLITDYDNICGWCEDSSTPLEEARVFGRERFLRFVQRWEWVNDAPGDLDYDTRSDLLKWAMSLWPTKEA